MTPQLLLKLCLVLLLSSLFCASLFSQTQEQAKTQVEGQLQTMTPEQIDKKIQELGLTKDEAIQKAKDYGISLDQYLQRAPSNEQSAVPRAFINELGEKNTVQDSLARRE